MFSYDKNLSSPVQFFCLYNRATQAKYPAHPLKRKENVIWTQIAGFHVALLVSFSEISLRLTQFLFQQG